MTQRLPSFNNNCAVFSTKAFLSSFSADTELHPLFGCEPSQHGILKHDTSQKADFGAIAATKSLFIAKEVGRSTFRASFVCNIDAIPFLVVEPTYIWLSPGDIVTMHISTNTDWKIE